MNTRKLINWIAAIFGILALVMTIAMVIFKVPDIPLSDLKTTYGSKTSRYIPIQGMSVHFRDEGPATDSLPLLLLHGSGASLHTWDSLVRLMPGKRCIRLDLPGFGLTGPHPLADYSLENSHLVLDSLLAFLKVDSCMIAGNSLGGLIAWTYAASHPSVKGLALIDAAGFPQTGHGGNIGFSLARTPVLNQLVKYITPRSIVEKSLRQSYGNPVQVSETVIQRYYDLNLREGNRQALIDRLQTQYQPDTTILSAIRIPALIIWGEKDQLIPMANAHKFKSALPNSYLVTYPELGHVPMEESPNAIAQEIGQWLVRMRRTDVLK